MKLGFRIQLQVLLMSIIIILQVATPRVAIASPLIQENDPVAQCQKGDQLYQEGKYEEAFPHLEAGFNNRDKANFSVSKDLVVCALLLGNLYFSSNKSEEAISILHSALDIARQNNNRYFEGVALYNIGTIYFFLGNYNDALEYFHNSLEIRREVDDLFGESITLSNIGVIYKTQGKLDISLEYYLKALEIEQKTNERENEGTTLNNIAGVYEIQGQYNVALEYYKQSLDIKKETNDYLGEAATMGNMAMLFAVLGRYSDAIEYSKQALEISQSEGDRRAEGTALYYFGSTNSYLGKYSVAMEYFQRALVIGNEINDPALIITSLNSLAATNVELGKYAAASEQLQEALRVSQEIGDIYQTIDSLVGLGKTYLLQGDYIEAMNYFEQALESARIIDSPPTEAVILNNIGTVFSAKQEYVEALEYFQLAYKISSETGLRLVESIILNNICDSYKVQKKYEEALSYCSQALNILTEIDNMQSNTLISIAFVLEKQGKYAEALDSYEKALLLLDDIRNGAGDDFSRATFISQYNLAYDLFISLSHRQEMFEQAFFTSERGRARSFLDSLSTGYVELSDDEATKLYLHEQEAYTARQAAQEALARAKAQVPSDTELITDLEVQLEQTKMDYQAALDAIEVRGDQLAQLVPGRSTVLNIEESQALLDNDTTLLSFWVLDDKTLVFILTQDSFKTISLSVEKADLYTLIEAFRAFSNTTDPHPDKAVELFGQLIKPILPHLNTSNLVIVPHGKLHYLPFAALTDGSKYLIDQFTISYLPSVSAWPYIKQNAETSGGTPLVLGNPTTEFQPLPYAKSEAQTIASLLRTSPALEHNATESALQEQAASTSILHLAAHGEYNSINPLYSALYLTADEQEDGALEVHEIYGLDLSQSQLVVLSACESQLGELSSGDELVGLTRAFFFAGTPSVMASLWEVDDKATELLMEKFYTHWGEGMSQAEALQKAQIEMRAEYPNPYYWAAFVLSGQGGEIQKDITLKVATELPEATVEASTVSTPTQVETPVPVCLGSLTLVGVVIFFGKRKKRSS